MNEQDTDFGDQVGGSHDINDMAPELPEAELYAAQSAAAEHDFQLFEQSRIFTEHGYSLFPGKKYSRVPYAAESVVQMPESLPPKTQRSSLRHKPNLSDTDSGDQSNTDASVSNGRRKRFKGGLNVFPNDLMSRPEEFNRIFPTFAPFEETVIGNREDGFQSSSSADSPRSPPPAIRTGFTSVENGRASSEENDFLTAVEPEQMHTDEALLFFEDQKSDEIGIDAASLGNFKTMLGSDRKAVPQYLKKGGSSKDLAEIGYNPEAVTINVNRSKSSVSLDRNRKTNAAQGKTKVKTLFKSGPVKDSPVKQDKGKTILSNKKSKVTKKATTPVKPLPKSASLNKKTFPKSRSIFKVSNKKLTAKQNRAVAAVRKRLQMSKKKREDVWCICRKPHGGRFMICCDQCNEWFHGSCVKVTAAEGKMLSKSGAEYVCPKCKPLKLSSSPSPGKENKKKAGPVKPIKRISTTSPVVEPPKVSSNPAKSRSAFSKMGLFDIGLPARKLLVSKKPEHLETIAKVADQKKKTMSAISSVRSKLLLKKATKQVRLPPPEKPVLANILKPSSSASSAAEDTNSVNDSKAPLRRSNRHQKDDESLSKSDVEKDSPNDSSTAQDPSSEKSSPVQVKIDTNLRRKKGQSISDSDDILSSPSAKTDSETESLTTSVKRILRHGRSPVAPLQSTSGNIVVTHNDQNVIEVSKKSSNASKPQTSEAEEKLLKPLPPAGVSKAKKRALLKATLIKNKSIWNSQYQQMKMALERSAKAKKEEEEEKVENEKTDDGKTGKRKPPDDDGKGGPPPPGASPGNSKGGNSKGGNSGGRRPSGRSKSPKSKSGKNGKESSSSQTPQRRQSPRKRPDITILIESFQFMSSNAVTGVSPCLVPTESYHVQDSCESINLLRLSKDYYQTIGPEMRSQKASKDEISCVQVSTDTKFFNYPTHILLKTKTPTEALLEPTAPSYKNVDGCVAMNKNGMSTSSPKPSMSQSHPCQSTISHLPYVQLLFLAAGTTTKTTNYLPLLQHLPLSVHLIISSWAFQQLIFLLLTSKALELMSQQRDHLMHLFLQRQAPKQQVPL